jgi:hypothetical protein
MTVRDTFDNIKEGDIVKFSPIGMEHEYKVDMVHGSGDDKVVSFGLNVENLKLVIINNKVNYEKRARRHPWGWTSNDIIKELKIVD